MHGKTAPSCLLHSQAGVRRGVRASGSYQEGTGKSGSYGMAYQGAAGFDPKEVIALARHAVDDVWPDLTVVIDLCPKEGRERTGRGKRGPGQEGQQVLFH